MSKEIYIPTDYESIFHDRMLIITGVSRSGTSILGKLIGSMRPTYYLFEPAIMKYTIKPYGCFPHQWDEFRGILFEDYFLPLIQGRSVNPNIDDESYTEMYWTGKSKNRVKRAALLSRRKDALKYIEDENPLFVIKANEMQPHFKILSEIFPGCNFIHIIRNGNDVVNSMLAKNWFDDLYVKTMVEWSEPGKIESDTINKPAYLGDVDIESWSHYDQVTRCACVWRSLVNHNFNKRFIFENKYESLFKYPEGWVNLFGSYGIAETEMTKWRIEAIERYIPKKYSLIINQIKEPEKSKFCNIMAQLGYKIP